MKAVIKECMLCMGKLPACLPACLPVCQPTCLHACLSIHGRICDPIGTNLSLSSDTEGLSLDRLGRSDVEPL